LAHPGAFIAVRVGHRNEKVKLLGPGHGCHLVSFLIQDIGGENFLDKLCFQLVGVGEVSVRVELVDEGDCLVGLD
jgi:hypothetical protein